MASLTDILCTPDNRPKVIRDAAKLVEDEVNAKGGLSGLAIKAGYRAVKAIKPALISEAIDSMLERFVERLEPLHQEWITGGKAQPFDAFLNARTSKVANALLGVTDDRARSIANSTIKKTYEALRPHGEKNVVAAVPGLGRLLIRYL